MVDLMFALAEILLVISYLFRDILFLRIVTNLGLLGYIAGGLIAGLSASGMTALVVFNILGFVINSYQIVRIFLDRQPILLPDDLKKMYYAVFHHFTPTEFLKLYRLAEVRQLVRGEQLTRQDQPVPELMLIKSGQVSIVINDKEITTIGPDFFVGEMSFLTGDLATATVVVLSETCEVVCWSKEVLYKLKDHNSVLFNQLNQTLGSNLIKKVNR